MVHSPATLPHPMYSLYVPACLPAHGGMSACVQASGPALHPTMMSSMHTLLFTVVSQLTRHVMLAIRAQILLPVDLARVPRLHWGMLQEG